jgi:ketosteroid isomerase-like protein
MMPTRSMTTSEFRDLLDKVAAAWERGDADAAADCFAEDAVYSEPPDRQLYQGRAQLYEFFGRNQSPPPPMSMTWHHVVFDEERLIGAGEYTFQGRNRYHGAVLIRIVNGKIANWREYQYRSGHTWDEFVGVNRF